MILYFRILKLDILDYQYQISRFKKLLNNYYINHLQIKKQITLI